MAHSIETVRYQDHRRINGKTSDLRINRAVALNPADLTDHVRLFGHCDPFWRAGKMINTSKFYIERSFSPSGISSSYFPCICKTLSVLSQYTSGLLDFISSCYYHCCYYQHHYPR
ncbi:hypothetical protein [Phaffia rhodozyma]|uniref:Uncharacterized protein n=1 Tax=Phaffia rhodozyma TaxID=264483 RepID=A0A0F7SKE4_PHARH|nr:hypothetical protein [Phaffia rhodozyma]